MPDHFETIYQSDAARYERLISREDQRGNLFQSLMDIHPFSGETVVEFGAGTGRLTRIMSVLVQSIHGFDIAPAMLQEGYRVLHETGMENWSFTQADNRKMPIANHSADIVVEGWSFGHVMGWYPQTWQQEVDKMLAEMQRIVKPDGTMILIETMGTGNRKPQAPSPELAALYAYWQDVHGYEYQWIRTDYQFESVAEADELMRFFFGDAMADQLVANKNIIVPECTGVWWKRA
ncbi:MAG: class I SAM-dependent methyltransferase [Phototrophicaceae bacterium]